MIRPVTCHEVKNDTEKLSSRKAAGYDKIQPRVLKLVAEERAPSLSMIFNSGIEQREWITPWKRGEWVPVFKNDDSEKSGIPDQSQYYQLWARFTKNS